ncbi:SRPBCC domain-containing protein [Lacicoccus qingdaonensis]|uniref:Activator of Hsp90 ATPase homolog 1-like protein n=1 Tax=Lacicoccus qingdaonensis TaxID=576118 RepID=A0A1G9HD29_9BACL|nr:SRPBCC domain-containing protein [Salinicoccus qingdaonensis]SDL10403.1 Activator of Hsp90 ATPase homolog 1-like protein [Salinicoccus qingdaonensis]
MTERIDEANLMISAPQETLYQAFLKEEAFKSWFTPNDMTSEIESFDPTEGGTFVVNLFYDDEEATGKTAGNTDRFTGTFKVLNPYNRVVFDIDFDTEDEQYKAVMEQEWTLIDQGNETEVNVVCRNVPDGVDQTEHERALILNLYRLADYVGATE